jgi:hypothetical protein
MAYDKVVDSAVLNANLTAVADAIRAKGGTSDPLSFPTGFADAIAAIQAGGGGAKIASGSVVRAASSNAMRFYHNLGVKPNIFFWFVSDIATNTTGTGVLGGTTLLAPDVSSTVCGGHMEGRSFYLRSVKKGDGSYEYTLFPDNTIRAGGYSGSSFYILNDSYISATLSTTIASDMVGETIRWVAAVV